MPVRSNPTTLYVAYTLFHRIRTHVSASEVVVRTSYTHAYHDERQSQAEAIEFRLVFFVLFSPYQSFEIEHSHRTHRASFSCPDIVRPHTERSSRVLIADCWQFLLGIVDTEVNRLEKKLCKFAIYELTAIITTQMNAQAQFAINACNAINF